MPCCKLDSIYVTLTGIIGQNQFNPRPAHWIVVMHSLNFFRKNKNYMLVYSSADLIYSELDGL